MNFSDLGLSENILKSIASVGYKTPTPIQAQAIPSILAGGDYIASAQTGTGKTAAFALPMLHNLSKKNYTKVRPIRALVLAPTRELASQVGASIKVLGATLTPKLRCIEVFGGVKIEAQQFKLKMGCDILVATPGRLLDLNPQNTVRLNSVEMVVLDEGDRLLEMGFLPDLKRLVALLPPQSQRMMFSATYNDEVERMSGFLLKKPQRLAPTTETMVVSKIRQVVHYVHSGDKAMALRALLERYDDKQVLVFVNTRAQAVDLSRALGFASISVGALHGDVDQKGRTKILNEFLTGGVRVLVATDVAARGLHIPDLPLVVNFELPTNIEDYVHRTGRTGRSGNSGRAVSLVAPGEMQVLGYIEELIGEKIERQKIAGFKSLGGQETHRKRKDEIVASVVNSRGVRKGGRTSARGAASREASKRLARPDLEEKKKTGAAAGSLEAYRFGKRIDTRKPERSKPRKPGRDKNKRR